MKATGIVRRIDDNNGFFTWFVPHFVPRTMVK